jgi:predicted nuclease of predicted toxin-antitoxin system
MTIWLDAQLSPALAPWISARFGVSAAAVRDVGLRDSGDREIFFAAREALAILVTKDSDFVRLLEKFGPPPQVIWLTFGNTSNARLKEIFAEALTKALELIQAGENVVEISAGWPGGAGVVL